MLSLASELNESKQTCLRILFFRSSVSRILRKMLQILQFSVPEEFLYFYTPLITEILYLTN